MKELNRNSNSVYMLNYHLVVVVKYRKQIFTNDTIIDRLKEFIKELSPKYGVEVINQECGTDHIHLLISTKPATELCKYINILKGHSSRMLRKEFSGTVKKELWGDSFWSPTYFISTVGNTSIDTIYKYIETQRQEQI